MTTETTEEIEDLAKDEWKMDTIRVGSMSGESTEERIERLEKGIQLLVKMIDDQNSHIELKAEMDELQSTVQRLEMDIDSLQNEIHELHEPNWELAK